MAALPSSTCAPVFGLPRASLLTYASTIPDAAPPPAESTYCVIGIYGEGAHSTVYKASLLGKIFALKRSKAIQSDNFPAVQREGSILMSMRKEEIPHSPCCTNILTIETPKGPECILVMDPVENTCILKGYSRNGKIDLPLSHTITITKQCLEHLNSLDAAKVIHGDFTLSNLLYSDTHRQLTVTDFESAHSTKTVLVEGTLTARWYRAPELMLGKPYDIRLDIWSLGCCLFECLTGDPFAPSPDMANEQDTLREQIRYIVARLGPPPFTYLQSCPLAPQFFAIDTDKQTVIGFVDGPKEILLEPWKMAIVKTAEQKKWTPDQTGQILELLDRMLQYDSRDRLSPAKLLTCPLFISDISFRFTTALPPHLAALIDRFEFFSHPSIPEKDSSTDNKEALLPILTVEPASRTRCLHLPATRMPYVVAAKAKTGEVLCIRNDVVIEDGDTVNFTASDGL